MRLALALVTVLLTSAAAATVVACKESAPARPPSEEPFKLTQMRELPSDSDVAKISEDAPVALPTNTSEDETPTSGTRPTPLGELDAGPVRECPKERKYLPTDIMITAEPRSRGIDAGALAGEVRFVLQNRRGIPRSIQVTELDRLVTLDGKAVPQQLRVTKVTFEEGGGGYPEAKIMLYASATAHLIVEFEPSSPPPWRAHIEVDGTPICVEGPGKRPF
ncbi:MAG: hypothetical protein JWM74_3199 [Myxococcaceae bacterium]|nr:hypothetical protein [Myxococcaceae bacterium]